MKTRILVTAFLVVPFLLVSCNFPNFSGIRVITPSDVSISENRDVSGFNAINFSTMGKVNIMQGDTESLNISGPDNLVPEISTSVRSGTLVIENKDNITINPLRLENPLTFTIVVKELASLDVSGAGDVQIETLSSPDLRIDMSGAGRIQLNQVSTDALNLQFSGLGGVEASGEAKTATIDMSGAGAMNAPDLKIQTAQVTISGLGGATLWVTDQLNGEISGAGSVSYYGNPQTQTNSSGLGSFKSLGNK